MGFLFSVRVQVISEMRNRFTPFLIKVSSALVKRCTIDSQGEQIPLLSPRKLQHGDLSSAWPQVWLGGERRSSPEPVCSLVSLLKLPTRDEEAAKEMLQVYWQSFAQPGGEETLHPIARCLGSTIPPPSTKEIKKRLLFSGCQLTCRVCSC